jgi:DNA-binding response OmpR family regulator
MDADGSSWHISSIMGRAPQRVLVVDDELKITEAVASYLRRAGYAPLTAAGGAEALRVFEFRLLRLFAGNPGRVFSREELISRALGDDFNGYDRTIDAHVKNLRQKIETDPRAPLYIHTVHGIGYRFSVEGMS